MATPSLHLCPRVPRLGPAAPPRPQHIQDRIIAVTHVLRYSTLYTAHRRERTRPTPYLDDLHTAVIRLLEEVERFGHQRMSKVRRLAATSGSGLTQSLSSFHDSVVERLA